MSRKIDLTNQRFGKLTVIEYAGKKQSGKSFKSLWKCKCDCGNEKFVTLGDLRFGHTTSCGCVHQEMIKNLNRKHGLSNKCGRLYPLWKSIRYRCLSSSSKDYERYGGRGITICDEWKDNFESFYIWAIANGYKEEKTSKGLNILTIDRIDVNKGYSPDNCRFVTNAVQARNKRNTMTTEERFALCPVCGNPFQRTQRNVPTTCSRSCGAKYRMIRRKENADS